MEDKKRQKIISGINIMVENNPNIRFRKDYYKSINMDIHIDINHLDEAPDILYDTLQEWWDTSYLGDLDSSEHIPIIIEQWLYKYIKSDATEEAIQKIRNANPPEFITIKLDIDLLSEDKYIKLEEEITDVPAFRPYITPPRGNEFSLDTYVYDPLKKKFISLEIIEQETLIDEGITPEIINEFYSFHQRLMEASSKKIRLYTAQPEERIDEWNRQGFIPKNSYLTTSLQRAEYYFNPGENDVIVDYRVPENQLIMTSDAFGAKEYVTLNNVIIE